jgi:hypothetical protein
MPANGAALLTKVPEHVAGASTTPPIALPGYVPFFTDSPDHSEPPGTP